LFSERSAVSIRVSRAQRSIDPRIPGAAQHAANAQWRAADPGPSQAPRFQARKFGISRKTGCKTLTRYNAKGLEGLN
jgi:hypothetical protein